MGSPLMTSQENQAMPTEEKDSYSLSTDEIAALWTYHHEAEFKHADRGEYGDAQYHKTRAAFWRERMTNG